MKRVGIYSGTFDPVHDGHIAFALAAAAQCGLDKVYFLVEPQPRRKQGVKAYEHRTAMTALAVQPHHNLGSIVLGQERFSVHETLPVLLERFRGAELCMLMGDDVITSLAHWPHVKELINNVYFVAGLRKRTPIEIQSFMGVFEQTRGWKVRYETVVVGENQLSSSRIRAQLRRGKTPEGVSRQVLDYISQNRLYVSTPAS